MKKTVSIVLLLVLALSLFAGCSGSKEYPSKDIQFYVGADAGGGTDSICRKVTQIVEEQGDAKFYLVNKPGVADAVAPSLCMDAEPDGYTICSLVYGASINAVYEGVMENYTMDRLQPIAMVTREADAIAASKDAPYKTFDEMIAYAKEHPGEIRASDQGIGSRQYMLLKKMELEYDIEFNKVSYQNSAQQREAMLNGEIDIMLSSLGDYAPVLSTGDAVALVEFSEVRNATYPDVPTCLELGMDESYMTGSFVIICGPAGMPEEAVSYLEAEYKKCVESDAFQEWTKSVGVTPSFMSSADCETFLKELQEKDFAMLDQLKAEGIM
jgi:tripartite-type tricarboxylate transporter receptor subunit TctC